jgi:hypothetical protein
MLQRNGLSLFLETVKRKSENKIKIDLCLFEETNLAIYSRIYLSHLNTLIL